MKFKYEVCGILENFLVYIGNQFNSKVLCIRSDNTLEMSAQLPDCYMTNLELFIKPHVLILHKKIGVVERKHMHLLETAKALNLQAKLPPKFWGHALLCTSYLINQMPLMCLDFQTPYFKLYNESFPIDYLKTFGYLCFVLITKINRTKFDPRAVVGVFVGHYNHTK